MNVRKKTFSPPVFFSLLLILLFSFSFSSAFTWNSDIDDICMETDVQYYDINVTEHADFNMDDVCYLYAKDPLYNGTPGHYHNLPDNHVTLNLLCYEVAYYFEDGHDWLRFESLNDTCYLPDTAPLSGDGFQFYCCEHGDCGDKNYGNVFSLNVSDACNFSGSGGAGGGGGGGTCDVAGYDFVRSIQSTTPSTWSNDTIIPIEWGTSNIDGDANTEAIYFEADSYDVSNWTTYWLYYENDDNFTFYDYTNSTQLPYVSVLPTKRYYSNATDTSLVAFYPLDNVDTTDNSTYGMAGDFDAGTYGFPATGDGSFDLLSESNCIVGKCLNSSGSGGWFNASDITLDKDSDWSSCFWFKHHSYNEASIYYLFGNLDNNGGNNGFALRYDQADSGDMEIIYGNGGGWSIKSYDTNTSDDGNWHHVCVLFNGTSDYATLTYDGAYVDSESITYGNVPSKASYFNIGANRVATEGWLANQFNGVMDEIYLWDEYKELTDVYKYYAINETYLGSEVNCSVGGGGGASAPVKNSSVPDIYLNGTDLNTTFLTEHFWNYTKIILEAEDPITDYAYQLYPGYGTIQGDYFELYNYNTNFSVSSYERPYNFTINISACNGLYDEYCVYDQVDVYIQTNLSGVLLINPFTYSDTLAVGETSLYSINYYFQYQDSVTLTMPESNYTGVLNSTFPFNWTVAGNHSECSDFLINYNCTYGNIYNYTALADVNVTLDCQEFNAYYTFAPYNEYNETITFNASNAVNSTWGVVYLSAGATGLPNNYCPGDTPSLLSNQSGLWTDFSDSLGNVYSDSGSLTDMQKRWIVLITLGIITVSAFVALMAFVPFMFNVLVVAVLNLLALVFFAGIGYVSMTRVYLIGIGLFMFFLIKFLFGRN